VKKCALVTGASGGLGGSIALQLAMDHQLHILVHYFENPDGAKQTRQLIEKEGLSAELIQFDIRDKESVAETIHHWTEQNPDKSITVLVNNAGMTKDGLFLWMSDQDWESVLDINLKGFFQITQLVLKNMMRNKFGRIINISSVSGVRGTAGQVNYSAAKAGLIGATKALAQEMARMNITVNAIAPGFIETGMVGSEQFEKFKQLIPMERLGTTEEVAHLASFLASEKSSYITGETININGGLHT
jgi:3-oxoacyl-[acyl-carrier protein] reductase